MEDADKEREVIGSESEARVVEKAVREVDTLLRDCKSCSLSGMDSAKDDESEKSELESAVQEEDNEDKGEVERSTNDVEKSGCVEVVKSAEVVQGTVEVVASAVDIKGTGLSDSVFFVVVL